MEQELKNILNKNNSFTTKFVEQENKNNIPLSKFMEQENKINNSFITKFVEQENKINNNSPITKFVDKENKENINNNDNKENKSYFHEFKNRHSIFIINFLKFLTDKKTLCSCSSLCILIIILFVFYMPIMDSTPEYTFPSYSYSHNPGSLFSNMPYDL
jgi:hypothetical protein